MQDRSAIASPPRHEVRERGTWHLILAVAATVGLGLRLWILRGDAGSVDSDEAVVGLMARHLLHGEWRAFFWGQHYGGTVETVLVAGATWLTDAPILALKLVPVALSGVAAALVWRIGRRLMDERLAQAAAGLFWLGPAAYLWLATRELGFYEVSLCIGLAMILSALRLAQDGRPREWLWFGALTGLGWWVSPLSGYALVPVGVWLLLKHRDVLDRAWLAAPGALIGAAPWLWHNVGQGWPSLHTPYESKEVSHVVGLGRLAWGVLPMVAGVRHVRSGRWLFPGAAFVFVALVVLLLATIWRRRTLPSIIGVSLVCFPVVYVVLPGRWWVGDGRYGLFAWPLLALTLAWALGRRSSLVVALVAVSILAVLGGRDIGSSHAPVHLGHDVGQLETAGIDRAWSDYWLAYRLTFESHERIVVTPTAKVRYEPYRRAVEVDDDPAVLFLADDPAVARFRATASRLGLEFRAVRTTHLVAFTFRSGRDARFVVKRLSQR